MEKLTTGNIPVYCDIKLCVLPTINSNSSISPWKLVALYTWGVGTGGQLGHAKFPVERSVLGEDYYNQAEPRHDDFAGGIILDEAGIHRLREEAGVVVAGNDDRDAGGRIVLGGGR